MLIEYLLPRSAKTPVGKHTDLLSVSELSNMSILLHFPASHSKPGFPAFSGPFSLAVCLQKDPKLSRILKRRWFETAKVPQRIKMAKNSGATVSLRTDRLRL